MGPEEEGRFHFRVPILGGPGSQLRGANFELSTPLSTENVFFSSSSSSPSSFLTNTTPHPLVHERAPVPPPSATTLQNKTL